MGLPPPPEGIDLGADRAPALIVVIIIFFVLSTVAIIARIISRMLSKSNLWLDDWLIVIYLVGSSHTMCRGLLLLTAAGLVLGIFRQLCQ